jgi:hypothetical protein
LGTNFGRSYICDRDLSLIIHNVTLTIGAATGRFYNINFGGTSFTPFCLKLLMLYFTRVFLFFLLVFALLRRLTCSVSDAALRSSSVIPMLVALEDSCERRWWFSWGRCRVEELSHQKLSGTGR